MISIQKKRTSTFNDQCMNQKTALTGSEGISHVGNSLRLRLLLLTPAHPFFVFLFILAHFATHTLDTIYESKTFRTASIFASTTMLSCRGMPVLLSLSRLPVRIPTTRSWRLMTPRSTSLRMPARVAAEA